MQCLDAKGFRLSVCPCFCLIRIWQTDRPKMT